MGEAVRAVAEMLGRYPGVQVARGEGRLEVKGSPGGFDIEVVDDGHEAMLDTGVWHSHYDSPRDTALLVAWMLSPRARIVVHMRRGIPVRSKLELLHDEGVWLNHGGFGLLMPIFGPKTVEVLSNSVISAADVPR